MLALAGCAADDDATCAPASYADPPAGAAPIVHVDGACAADAPDGSVERPFATLGAAVLATPPGGAVLVAAGTYPEQVVVSRAIAVIGAAKATTVVNSPAVGLYLQNTSGVSVKGLTITGASGAGLVIHSASGTVEDVAVTGTTAGSLGPGYGVSIEGSSTVTLTSVTASGSASVGVLIAGGIATLQACDVRDNAGGGITAQGETTVTLQDTTVEANAKVGVLVLGARFEATAGRVAGTLRAADGQDKGGDGVVAAELNGVAPTLTLRAVDVADNARIGVLAGGAAVVALDGGSISRSGKQAGGSVPSVTAGVWLQQQASATVTDTRIDANRMVGIGLTAAARATLSGVQVLDTAAFDYVTLQQTVSLGDGIAVMGQASASISQTRIAGSARAGVLFDAATADAQTVYSGNTVQGGEYGVVLQHSGAQPVSQASLDAGFTVTGATNGGVSVDADLAVFDGIVPTPAPSVGGPVPWPE